jgi:hypothetical protein
VDRRARLGRPSRLLEHKEVSYVFAKRNQILAIGALGALATAPLAATAAAEDRLPPPEQRLVERLRPVAELADSGAENRRERTYRTLHARAERRELSPGRNIVEDGVRAGRRVRPATTRELTKSIRDLRGMLGGGSSSSSTGGGTGASAQLQSIAACESGGDPSAVGGGGLYRGKYQFDRQTWQSVGGSGDPAAASEAEQDRRAAALVAKQGTAAWPNCGG